MDLDALRTFLWQAEAIGVLGEKRGTEGHGLFAERARELLRQLDHHEADLYEHGLHIDRASTEVRVDGRPVSLTHAEYEILRLLHRYQGLAVQRDMLACHVWKCSVDDLTAANRHTLDTHVSTLRKKLDDEDRERFIQAVRTFGYTLLVT